MKIDSAGLTDVGQRRKLNEDAFLVEDAIGRGVSLYVVADGMGGHAAGEIASAEALDAVHSMVIREIAKLERLSKGPITQDIVHSAQRVLEAAVQNATYQVFGIAQHEPEQQGMGTTLSALALVDPCYAITAQVGDSRIYSVPAQPSDSAGNRPVPKQALMLTEDHTLVAWQLKQGIITEEEALLSPHKNVITRAVGSREYVQVDTRFLDVQSGDAFMLCSDGLHGYVPDVEIADIVALGPKMACERFIQLANDRGGRDNITCVVIQVHEVG
ncbi:MAG: serine/threonine-protein phosphatase [Deltaproteobacteria bacterium]|nr:serine/threonine-protein phosphatase [Deltaproteobacteria bacterium]